MGWILDRVWMCFYKDEGIGGGKRMGEFRLEGCFNFYGGFNFGLLGILV